MKQSQEFLSIETRGYGFVDITDDVSQFVSRSGIEIGLCHLFVLHTSASLIIQENADPRVRKDLENFFKDLVPESRRYLHHDEGPDDMPAHIRTALTHTSETVPIRGGRLCMGTWQAVYLWEHRRVPHERRIVIHCVGE